MDPTLLTGRTETHLCTPAEAADLGAPVHHSVVGPFRALRSAAAGKGFDLTVLSGFRGFDRQCVIWNQKAAGDRAVLDSAALPLDIATLSERDLVFAILRWSALPGASRHHWGTDVDVIDAAALPDGYEVQLVPDEVDPGGMFGPLHDWLDARIAVGSSFGFFRPYDRDRGGVAPERWHMSLAPVAAGFMAGMTVEVLRNTIRAVDLRLKHTVLAHLEEIYERFVLNTGSPPA